MEEIQRQQTEQGLFMDSLNFNTFFCADLSTVICKI